MKKPKTSYHHGDLAESLLNAVDELATKFGLEAVTLRSCAKRVGVSPSSAFRHYADKRTLLTAFATRALMQLSTVLASANKAALHKDQDAFLAVSLAYIKFAIEKPAFFRAMWREETIYTTDDAYMEAIIVLTSTIKGGFASSLVDDDASSMSSAELLAWSSVHGLANLLIDGPVGNGLSKAQKTSLATDMLELLQPALEA
ncbi:MAG: TetR/AcrR family transcriptional regulator [Granulosicoccaceae bacterium]